MNFTLDPRLTADCVVLGDAPLCRWLLMNDARYPWCILVPRRAGVREIFELDAADRAALLAESVQLGQAMMQAFRGDKLNVAALGNVVAQLHVHHVVRHHGDAAWPAPVWGRGAAVAYGAEALAATQRQLRAALPQWRIG